METTAIVAGATGLVGRFLTEILEKRPKFDKIHVFQRKKGNTVHGKFEYHFLDFGKLETAGFDFPADVVFCSLGTTHSKAGSKEAFEKVDHDYVLSLGKLGRKLGAKRFILVSSIGANADSWNHYLQVKGKTEKDLEAMGYEHLVILRPSLLLGPREETRIGEVIGEKAIKFLRPLFIGPLRKQLPVHASQVAEAMFDFSVRKDLREKVILVESQQIRKYPQFELPVATPSSSI